MAKLAATANPEDIEWSSVKGHLVVFEGPDGVGKSTLIDFASRYLGELDVDHEVHSFPGTEAQSLGALIYRLHHTPAELGVKEMTPLALQTLHIAAHLDAIEQRILPALRSSKLVLLDRFWWSTWVYGIYSGVTTELIEALVEIESKAWKGQLPAAVVLPNRELEAGVPQGISELYRMITERNEGVHPILSVDMNQMPDVAVKSLFTQLDDLLPTVRDARSRELHTLKSAPKDTITTIPKISRPFDLAKATPAYDSYWHLAAERQAIFFRRLAGESAPWTRDPILNQHKFTNAYRASDRVSQYLIRNVIYSARYSDKDLLFRIILFKLFNRIDTWETLIKAFGDVTYDSFDYERYDSVLEAARARGEKIYSAAYIMPSAGNVFNVQRKHQAHLLLLDRMIKDELWKRLQDAASMDDAYNHLLAYPSIGSFLAYQYVIDLNYSPLMDFSENDFVMPGPGARDGISKCFTDLQGMTEAEIIREVCSRQAEEFQRLGINFLDLWGRPLQMIDCQNLFCEVSKYARVRHPEIVGVAGRTRIKQIFQPTDQLLEPKYPPKWGLQDRIDTWLSQNRRAPLMLFPTRRDKKLNPHNRTLT